MEIVRGTMDRKRYAHKDNYNKSYTLYVRGRGKKWYIYMADSARHMIDAELPWLDKGMSWQIWECHGPHFATLAEEGKVTI